MKLCTTCKEEKQHSEFNKNRSRPDGLGTKCRMCMKAYRDEYYKKNKALIISQNSERRKAIKSALITNIFAYLEDHPCVDCGNDDPRVLEFDHLPGYQKVAEIGEMIQNSWSWHKVLEEIQKCEVRCANCHRIITSLRGMHYRSEWVYTYSS